MWLSRMDLDLRDRDLRAAVADVDALHRIVVRAFAAQVPPDVPGRKSAMALHQFSPPTPGMGGRLLVQSALKPDWSFLPTQTVAVKNIASFWDTVTTGARFRFRIDAAPERSRVNNLLHEPFSRGGCKSGRRAIRDPGERIAWLGRRLVGAAELVEVDVSAGSRVQGARRGAPVTFLPVTFSGVLAVTDGSALRALAADGIGPRKAWGMGLLAIERMPAGG